MDIFDFEVKLLEQGYELCVPVLPDSEVWKIYKDERLVARITTGLIEWINEERLPLLFEDLAERGEGLNHE